VMYAGLIVEGQSTVNIFAAPLHPYTAGLLRARPILERRRERLEVIPGRPPHADEIAYGCPFSPRCPFAQDECALRPPALCEVSPGGFSACWRSSELTGQLTTEGSA
jgi:oligopeptide/dipeptide ABC transporter ATP-binding protein